MMHRACVHPSPEPPLALTTTHVSTVVRPGAKSAAAKTYICTHKFSSSFIASWSLAGWRPCVVSCRLPRRYLLSYPLCAHSKMHSKRALRNQKCRRWLVFSWFFPIATGEYARGLRFMKVSHKARTSSAHKAQYLASFRILNKRDVQWAIGFISYYINGQKLGAGSCQGFRLVFRLRPTLGSATFDSAA